MQWLRRGFSNYDENSSSKIFFHIPKYIIIEWISKKPDIHASFMAHFMPIDIFFCGESMSLTRELLKIYGQDKNFRDSLHANFNTGNWCGAESDHYKKMLRSLRNLKDIEKNRNILLWLDEGIEMLQKPIHVAKIREEREEI